MMAVVVAWWTLCGARDTSLSLRDFKGILEDVTDESTTLYRPVGQQEFELVRESGFRSFPPRLPDSLFSILYSPRNMQRRLRVTGILKTSARDLWVTFCDSRCGRTLLTDMKYT
jgi:hypothetical protein